MILTDKNGKQLKPGDRVHNDWGYDLIIKQWKNGEYYGKLICEKTHSCRNITYSIIPSELTKIEDE